MDVLKKIRSATLVEVLVATVLIVVIFVVSSLIINNLLVNEFNNNSNEIETRLNELEYEYQFRKIKLPYNETFQNWEIFIIKKESVNSNVNCIEFKAQKKQSKKIIVKTRIDEQ